MPLRLQTSCRLEKRCERRLLSLRNSTDSDTQAIIRSLYCHITLREITIFKQQHGKHPNGYREAQ